MLMSRSKAIAATLALGAAIAASPPAAAAGDPPNRGLDSINQPVVQRTDYVLDLASEGNGLSAVERGRLYAWFQSLGIGYGDRVWVDEPYGATRTRIDVARIAAEYGLLLKDGAPITPGEVRAGSVRVIVSRSFASVPNCPNWSGRGGTNSTSPNYGCAMNSNLAAMIADPSDLVLGQVGSGTGDANDIAKVIKVYRDTAPTGTKGLTNVSTTGN
jgi:pilus assembly protein CpaD